VTGLLSGLPARSFTLVQSPSVALASGTGVLATVAVRDIAAVAGYAVGRAVRWVADRVGTRRD
jgi:hypothetical protein